MMTRPMRMMARALGLLAYVLLSEAAAADDFQVTLQRRIPAEGGEDLRIARWSESWDPAETAVIICDMWDSHHCLNAVRRVKEVAPRADAFVRAVRDAGGLVIHAPSDCMEAYSDHPGRERAKSAPKADDLPDGIERWMHWIDDAEEKAGYPIDASDGGEDDDPAEHAAWQKELAAMGRNPQAPWKRQIDVITIDGERDAITDSGIENWNLLEARGIRNVFLLGVHTNMCVLGRPFGLRQLAKNGVNVALVRDLTDTMYNPAKAPHVSHFHGTDLVIEHVETFVCPTVASSDVLGGASFRFSKDNRPKLVVMIGEREYKTAETLPAFARDELLEHFRIEFVTASEKAPNEFPGLEPALEDGAAALVSVRRRALPEPQLAALRKFVESGKPMIGIRTASHAFAVRGDGVPEGHAQWPEFDAMVWGGNYTGHHGSKAATRAAIAPGQAGHPIVSGLPGDSFPTGGSLYINTPLDSDASVLLIGTAEGFERPEPVAWTHTTDWDGRAFYTSLGHPLDFAEEAFRGMLRNACLWAAGVEAGRQLPPSGR